MKIRFTKPSGKPMSIEIADAEIKKAKSREKFIDEQVRLYNEADKTLVAEKLGEMYDAVVPPKVSTGKSRTTEETKEE